MTNDEISQSSPSRPVRTIAAGVVMFVAGWALAGAITHVLANISVPTFSRVVLPAKFTYGLPAGMQGSAALRWVIAALCFAAVPFCVNGSWLTRRIVSVPGIVKLLAATLLLALLAVVVLMNGDLTATSPFGGGAKLSLIARFMLIAFAGVCGGILLAAFGEGMPEGAPDRWRVPASERPMPAFATGFIASVVMAMLALVAVGGMSLLQRALFGFLGESAEVSPLGWQRLQLGLTLAIGLLLATCGAVLTAVAPAPVPQDWRAGSRRIGSLAIAALPALALVSLVIWFRSYTRSAGEMDRTLAQVAGLDAAPEAQLMVLPANSGVRVQEYRMEVSLPGLHDEIVGATSGNIEHARAYVTKLGGRWTTHTLAAWELPGYVYDRLLQPDSALRARMAAAEATGSVLATAIVMSKVRGMPASPMQREAAARLLDSAHFIGSEQATIRLQGEARTPHDRTVTGQVLLPEQIRPGARVGLYRQTSAEPQASIPSALSLVAATTLDQQGRFVFDSLPPSFYTIGVLLPSRAGHDFVRAQLSGRMHVADVTGEHLRDDMSSVTVTVP